jgi:cation:H+ antiporter
MFLPFLLFIAGLLLLVKGADITVDGAKDVALGMGCSPLFVGTTVIAFGTSLPELVVTTEAFSLGNFGVGMGNIIGSNIANIALILGMCALIRPDAIARESGKRDVRRDMVIMVLATGLFILFSLRSTLDGVTGIVFLTCFSWILIRLPRSDDNPDPVTRTPKSLKFSLAVTVLGLFLVITGAHLLLAGAVAIARLFFVPEFLIGFSLVAIGTSLPELATSVAATLKGSLDIAVGNVLGSNVFNLIFIPGLNSLFFVIPVPVPWNLVVLLAFSLAVLLLVFQQTAMTRAWGAVMLGAYVGCVMVLFFFL